MVMISLFRGHLTPWDVDLLLSTSAPPSDSAMQATSTLTADTGGVFLAFFDAEIRNVTQFQILNPDSNPSPHIQVSAPHTRSMQSKPPIWIDNRDPSACQNGKIVGFSHQLLRNHRIHGAIDQKGIAKNAGQVQWLWLPIQWIESLRSHPKQKHLEELNCHNWSSPLSVLFEWYGWWLSNWSAHLVTGSSPNSRCCTRYSEKEGR